MMLIKEKQLEKIDKAPKHTKRRQLSEVPCNDISKVAVGSLTPEEIEKQTADLYQNKGGVFSCLACNYTSSDHRGRSGRWLMKRHIEVHLDGLSYPCKLCNKEFRSKNSLIKHKSTYH